ncbi:MAG: sigma-70 family RNA polymerase sigma factor [Gemmatimonadaceae bacterium]|nr:sigma-70 family RNA polymerase sigma factor [Gemmatimonadaceae bacterium]
MTEGGVRDTHPPGDPPTLPLAIEATLTRLARMIRAVGARHGLGDDELDALVQDVRIRLWRAQASGESIRDLPTSYVYRAAMSAAVDAVRKRRREEEREPPLETVAPSALAASGSTDASVLASELRAAIARAMADMVPARATVVQMYLKGYDREEMMRLLGYTDDKIRNLLYRGLQDLRERLVKAGHRWPEDG